MSAAQLDMLLSSEVAAVREKAVASMRDSWLACWRWHGPQVGGLLEIGSVTVPVADGSGSLYCYMEQARVESIEGDVIVAVLEGNAYPGTKDGTRLRLDLLDVWAPVKAIRAGLPIYSGAVGR